MPSQQAFGTLGCVVVLIGAACSPPEERADAPSGRRWYRGGLHTHSTFSDGVVPAPDVAAHYEALGYDFLVLTDHDTSSDFAQYSRPSFLTFDGEELSAIGAHVGGLAIDGPIAVQRGAMSAQAAVDAVCAAGGVPVVNHPTWSKQLMHVNDVLGLTMVSLMEVYNHVTDRGFDEVMWDAVLTAGKPMFGVAADDFHSLRPGAHGPGYG